jgi:hypothetical protein
LVLAPAAGQGNLAPLQAIRYLVDAAERKDVPPRSFYQRTIRTIELFETLAHRRRGGLQVGSVVQTPYAGAD